MVWLLGLFRVIIRAQELLLVVVGARAQGVTLEVEPAGPPVIMKLTVPTGGLFVPLAVSSTVTVQLSGLLAGVDAGQSSVVGVGRAHVWTIVTRLLRVRTDAGTGM